MNLKICIELHRGLQVLRAWVFILWLHNSRKKRQEFLSLCISANRSRKCTGVLVLLQLGRKESDQPVLDYKACEEDFLESSIKFEWRRKFSTHSWEFWDNLSSLFFFFKERVYFREHCGLYLQTHVFILGGVSFWWQKSYLNCRNP